MSRVTLHRVERGEASVTVGAWLNVLDALGLALDMGAAPQPVTGWQTRAPQHAPGASLAPVPALTVAVAHYPQLQTLAWSIPGATVLTAQEAFGLYERNWRHLDRTAMEEAERELLAHLVATVGRGQLLV